MDSVVCFLNVLCLFQASYVVETRDGLCYVTVRNTAVELTFLSLGGMLVEHSFVMHKTELTRGRLDLTSRSVNTCVCFVCFVFIF